jgi:hypothetical protein
MPVPHLPTRSRGPIIATITITTRIARTLITRLVDSFGGMVDTTHYSRHYVLAIIPLLKMFRA